MRHYLRVFHIMVDTDEEAALAVCLRCLASLKKIGVTPDEGRKELISTLAPVGTASHGRGGLGRQPAVQFESFREGFADRMPWHSDVRMEEPLSGPPTILVDHDLAMVWTPYYFLTDGEVTHVGTNCFTLLKADWTTATSPTSDGKAGGPQRQQAWKITGMTDTARKPTLDDMEKIDTFRKGQDLELTKS